MSPDIVPLTEGQAIAQLRATALDDTVTSEPTQKLAFVSSTQEIAPQCIGVHACVCVKGSKLVRHFVNQLNEKKRGKS